ncbi:kinesin-like protein Pkl1 [Schizosaccharomyces japonicus yFS275]|uniref:Kinesin-like protein n=1 Tax=Schizosaccharomyces japonicus (strain yFS275 / FY16936) TaxID=402676 RepID=B6JY87_SCHJY|nr:kinesin-like protein Pkl1 [Schizosaccharomyces japonicus yFS275]EEB06505.1 kinesin-like protein Pkl1 [Schizosaccharomyces japonicus yFS275]
MVDQSNSPTKKSSAALSQNANSSNIFLLGGVHNDDFSMSRINRGFSNTAYGRQQTRFPTFQKPNSLLSLQQSSIRQGLDDENDIDSLENAYFDMKSKLHAKNAQFDEIQTSANTKLASLQAALDAEKKQVTELTAQVNSCSAQYTGKINGLQTQLSVERQRCADLQKQYAEKETVWNKNLAELKAKQYSEQLKWCHEFKSEIDAIRISFNEAMDEVQVNTQLKYASYEKRIVELQRAYEIQYSNEEEKHKLIVQDLQRQLNEIQQIHDETQTVGRAQLEELQSKVSEALAQIYELQRKNATLVGEINLSNQKNESLQQQMELIQSSLNSNTNDAAQLQITLDAVQRRNDELERRLMEEEKHRRRLHNVIQDLKGNIRVFCRVRPVLPVEAASISNPEIVMKFPDIHSVEPRELVLEGLRTENSLGQPSTKIYNFSFDRVFPPNSSNLDVFQELSEFVQSALDGYNVSIFAYGQTGSGKTHTMSSSDGVIPRAAAHVFQEVKRLEEKGWKYQLTAQMIEIYNERIRDLLSDETTSSRKRLEIHHDERTRRTRVTDSKCIYLETEQVMQAVLQRASERRSVAATKANERSSRSHSVFTLHIDGVHAATKEKTFGSLSLVDLAGSERLAHSQAVGDRLRETQAINKSLSCLGDVIAALASNSGNSERHHIPYRNSKLTYLLKYSLGGDAKTLMFVNVSPLRDHFAESLNSLRFATKVNSTRLGVSTRTASKPSTVIIT